MTTQSINPISQPPDLSQPKPVVVARAKAEPAERISSKIDAAVAGSASREPSQAHLEAIAKELNQFSERISAELSFSVDHDLGQVIVTVTKPGSDEVIRQIPSREVVDLIKRLKEMQMRGDAKGVLVGLEG